MTIYYNILVVRLIFIKKLVCSTLFLFFSGAAPFRFKTVYYFILIFTLFFFLKRRIEKMADGKADFKPDYGFPDPDVVIAKMTVGETFGLPAVGYASGMAWAYSSFASRSAVCGWGRFLGIFGAAGGFIVGYQRSLARDVAKMKNGSS